MKTFDTYLEAISIPQKIGNFEYKNKKLYLKNESGKMIEIKTSENISELKKVLDPLDEGHSNPYFWKDIKYGIKKNNGKDCIYIRYRNIGEIE